MQVAPAVWIQFLAQERPRARGAAKKKKEEEEEEYLTSFIQ